MKKFISLILLAALTMTMSLGFSSCKDENSDDVTTESVTTVDTTIAGEEDTTAGDTIVDTEVDTTAENTTIAGETSSDETTESDETEPHTHTYGDWKTTNEPTCTKEGSKEKSCSCGDTITEAVIALGHNIVNNECTRCDYKKPVSSEGLEFKLNSDKASYSVIGIGTCKDKDVVIPSTYNDLTVTAIGEDAFWDCSSLTSVVIPNSVTSIDAAAFYACKSLTSVTISDSVRTISDYVFYRCTSLESVVIPNSVTSIGDYVFYGCTALESVNVDSENPNYKSIDGNLYNKDGATLLYYAVGKKSSSFTTPDGVICIGWSAFEDCTSIKSVTISDSIISIGSAAFRGCTSLESVIIGNRVANIDTSAFVDCTSLESIIIPNSVTSIGSYAFMLCSNLTINCEAESTPSGWSDSWNDSNRPVVWGYKGE